MIPCYIYELLYHCDIMVAMVMPLFPPRSEGSVSIVVRGGPGVAVPVGEWTAHQKVSFLTHNEVNHN